MKWNQYTIHTTTEAEDSVAYLLSELGIDGVEIVDKKEVLEGDTKDLFEDVMPVQEADDGKADVIFYLDEETDDRPVLDAVLKGLNEMRSYLDPGECTIVRSVTEDQDWANNWKTYFHAFTVGDFLIKPTWVEVPEGMTGRYLVEIDPGSAFGTGSHETTKLCITALTKNVRPGDRVLDVGTGSGILSIAALKLGASEALGTDIDELAVEAAEENRDRNGIEKNCFRVLLGDIITDETLQEKAGDACFDIAVANILADVIIPLQKEVVRHLKPGGTFIASGIINTKADAVRKALTENEAFTITEEQVLGEWVSFTARKKG